ncbi:uncharacterized protein LOC134816934 [Bolinopsis microptera]|uniref:uncharacterized protein LOC134816934 n=1 Tax=Bolinopsis microptera TaxID=2820187 RepID=UPI00307956C9
MPTYKILKPEWDVPPSLYGKLTKGTFLEPWMYRSFENYFYFNAPINVWEKDSSMFERITRAGHIGFCIGALQGFAQGFLLNLSMGKRGADVWKNKAAYKMGAFGLGTGILGTTAFAVTVSQLSKINGRAETTLDWYWGGLASGVVTVCMSQVKGTFFSRKWNMASIFLFPLLPTAAKYLHFVNEYDDPKGGRYPMQAGGQQYHSVAEMRGLYGIEPHEAPFEKVLKKPHENDMLFMLPRQNPRWNDKYRVEQ